LNHRGPDHRGIRILQRSLRVRSSRVRSLRDRSLRDRSLRNRSLRDRSSRDFYTDANGTSMNIILIIRIEGMSPFFRSRMIGKTLTRVTAGTRVGVSGASLSPTEDCVLIFEISKDRHDRSCLEMSEADGVDGGAFRKRGLTHLQWAEKPEAPEAERHLVTRDLEVPVSSWVPECSNLLAVGPGSEILALYENLMGSNIELHTFSIASYVFCIFEGMSPFFRSRMIGKTLTRVTAGTRVGVSGASLSPTEDCVLIFEISKDRHDRSCLEMSEADGVDGGAFRKRGLTHLQWAEKPEAPEAERHLGTRNSRVPVSPWVPECSNLLAVGPGSEILALYDNLMGSKYFRANSCILQNFSKFFLMNSKLKIEIRVFYVASYIFGTFGKTLTRVTAGTRVGVSGASLSPTEDCVLIFEISKDRHDRSCLEMSEADGVDGGAFRKRGLTHLQWAEKPEAPEAERHLGTRNSRVPVSPWVPECSNLLAVGPGSEILALYDNLMGSKYFRANSCILQNFSKFFLMNSKLKIEIRVQQKPSRIALSHILILLCGKTLTRVTAGTRVSVSGASLSPTEDCVLILISKDRHDRSCLEMSEADGVDGGAFRKRGLTHLQWAEKPEAPEAERHLGTRNSRVPVSPWVPECSNLLAVGPGSEILALYDNLMGSKYFRANSCILQNFSKFFLMNSKLKMEIRVFYVASYIFGTFGKTLTRVTAGTRVGVSGASLSPTEDCVLIFEISKDRHDRSCLEMSEADGVDGGAFRKRGLTHLQWAEKPEAPEAERHLGTRNSRVPVSPWVPECSNLLAVGPGSEILALYDNLMGSNVGLLTFSITSYVFRIFGKTLTRVTAGTHVGVSGASLSPAEDCVLILISKYRHDRSCLEMSEADGVDGGAFRKRGLTHLQWAEKPEAPEAERHLESPLARGSPNAATSSRWDLGRKSLLYMKILWEASISERIAAYFQNFSEVFSILLQIKHRITYIFHCILRLLYIRHDRSCLEMSEADGVDGGAFRQRGLTHLQWAEKPEAPEAERHLGTRISRVSVSPWVRECSNLLAVGAGSEILPLDENLMGRNFKLYIAVRKTLTRVTAGTRVGVSGASLSPTEDCVLIFEISKYRHDRSCLDMSEADGVDGGAFRKRGLTHLQWAEKPEAPEAERPLGTRIRWCPRSRLSPSLVPTYSTYSRECSRDTRVSIVSAVGFNLGSRRICRESTTGRAQVPVGPRMQQPPRGGTWVGNTCMIQSSMIQVLPGEWLHISINFQ
ncbi:LOW QUALITY PROTEIN: hypothetical protein V1478_008862, partial [Vespula squamosa]